MQPESRERIRTDQRGSPLATGSSSGQEEMMATRLRQRDTRENGSQGSVATGLPRTTVSRIRLSGNLVARGAPLVVQKKGRNAGAGRIRARFLGVGRAGNQVAKE